MKKTRFGPESCLPNRARAFYSEVHCTPQWLRSHGQCCDSRSEKCLIDGLRRAIGQLYAPKETCNRMWCRSSDFFYDILCTVSALDCEFKKLDNLFSTCTLLNVNSRGDTKPSKHSINDMTYLNLAAKSLMNLINMLKSELLSEVRTVEERDCDTVCHTHNLINALETKLIDLMKKLEEFKTQCTKKPPHYSSFRPTPNKNYRSNVNVERENDKCRICIHKNNEKKDGSHSFNHFKLKSECKKEANKPPRFRQKNCNLLSKERLNDLFRNGNFEQPEELQRSSKHSFIKHSIPCNLRKTHKHLPRSKPGQKSIGLNEGCKGEADEDDDCYMFIKNNMPPPCDPTVKRKKILKQFPDAQRDSSISSQTNSFIQKKNKHILSHDAPQGRDNYRDRKRRRSRAGRDQKPKRIRSHPVNSTARRRRNGDNYKRRRSLSNHGRRRNTSRPRGNGRSIRYKGKSPYSTKSDSRTEDTRNKSSTPSKSTSSVKQRKPTRHRMDRRHDNKRKPKTHSTPSVRGSKKPRRKTKRVREGSRSRSPRKTVSGFHIYSSKSRIPPIKRNRNKKQKQTRHSYTNYAGNDRKRNEMYRPKKHYPKTQRYRQITISPTGSFIIESEKSFTETEDLSFSEHSKQHDNFRPNKRYTKTKGYIQRSVSSRESFRIENEKSFVVIEDETCPPLYNQCPCPCIPEPCAPTAYDCSQYFEYVPYECKNTCPQTMAQNLVCPQECDYPQGIECEPDVELIPICPPSFEDFPSEYSYSEINEISERSTKSRLKYKERLILEIEEPKEERSYQRRKQTVLKTYELPRNEQSFRKTLKSKSRLRFDVVELPRQEPSIRRATKSKSRRHVAVYEEPREEQSHRRTSKSRSRLRLVAYEAPSKEGYHRRTSKSKTRRRLDVYEEPREEQSYRRTSKSKSRRRVDAKESKHRYKTYRRQFNKEERIRSKSTDSVILKQSSSSTEKIDSHKKQRSYKYIYYKQRGPATGHERYVRLGKFLRQSSERVIEYEDVSSSPAEEATPTPTSAVIPTQTPDPPPTPAPTPIDIYSRGTATEVISSLAKRTSTTDIIKLIKTIGTNTQLVNTKEQGIDPIPQKQKTPPKITETKTKFTFTDVIDMRTVGTDSIPQEPKPTTTNIATDPIHISQKTKETNTMPEKKKEVRDAGIDSMPVTKVQQTTVATDPLYYLGQSAKRTSTTPLVTANAETETMPAPVYATKGTSPSQVDIKDKQTSYDRVKTTERGQDPILKQMLEKGQQFDTVEQKPKVKHVYTGTDVHSFAGKVTQTSFVEEKPKKPTMHSVEVQTSKRRKSRPPEVDKRSILRRPKKNLTRESAIDIPDPSSDEVELPDGSTDEPETPDDLIQEPEPEERATSSELSMHLTFEKCHEEIYRRRQDLCKSRCLTNNGNPKKFIVCEKKRSNTIRITNQGDCETIKNSKGKQSPEIDLELLLKARRCPQATAASQSNKQGTPIAQRKNPYTGHPRKTKLSEDCGMNVHKGPPNQTYVSRDVYGESNDTSCRGNITATEEHESGTTLRSFDWRDIADKVKDDDYTFT